MSRRGRALFGRTAAVKIAAAVSVVATAIFFCAVEALAQCAMCRTALEDGGGATARTMNLGIIVLLIPPVAIFCTIFAVAYRKGKVSDDQS